MLEKVKEKSLTIAIIVILITGVSLLLYPTISDHVNAAKQITQIANYNRDIEKMTEQKQKKMLSDARDYNSSLRQGIVPNLNLTSNQMKVYNQTLNVTGQGIMAYVEIPKLNLELPVYHGTSDSVLRVALGHLPGTSLPVGGKGSHAVISGHRGLPSARLFTDIDQLAEGDTFKIQVIDKTLLYEVDRILTISPEDRSPLRIDPDQDYVTLMTCTPYGINTERLLVRGHRIANKENSTRIVSEASQFQTIIVVILISCFILTIILLAVVVIKLIK